MDLLISNSILLGSFRVLFPSCSNSVLLSSSGPLHFVFPWYSSLKLHKIPENVLGRASDDEIRSKTARKLEKTDRMSMSSCGAEWSSSSK